MLFRNEIEELRTLNAMIRHKLEVGEAVAEQIREVIERIGKVEHIADRLILGRAVRVASYDDPQLDDSAQVWIPGLSFREGIGVVLVDLHEFSYLRTEPRPLEAAFKNQFVVFSQCTAKMRDAVWGQVHALIDRALVIALIDES